MLLNDVKNIFLGSAQVSKIYLGNSLLWPKEHPVTIPANEIWYKSYDEQIITPYSTAVWPVNIVSNTYTDGLGKIVFDADITNIPEYAFYTDMNLKNIYFSDSVRSIGQYCFADGGIESIEIPPMVDTITSHLLYRCHNLIEVKLPDNIRNIGYAAFTDDMLITEITIPNKVETIGESAFRLCKGLTEITLPSTLKQVDGYAFSESNIKLINCYAMTQPSVVSNSLRNLPTYGTLHTPVGSDYSTWMKTNSYYLGKYYWTNVSDL